MLLARFEVPCSTLSLEPPPAPIELRAFPRGGHGWFVFARSEGPWDGDHDEWMHHWPGLMELPGTTNPRNRRFLAADLPPGLKRLMSAFQVAAIRVQPDGTVGLSVRGTREELRSFEREVTSSGSRLKTLSVWDPPPPKTLLTARQHEMLLAALDQGYYDLPRGTNLRALAQSLGVTSASLSEILRRAEGVLVERYFADLRETMTRRALETNHRDDGTGERDEEADDSSLRRTGPRDRQRTDDR